MTRSIPPVSPGYFAINNIAITSVTNPMTISTPIEATQAGLKIRIGKKNRRNKAK